MNTVDIHRARRAFTRPLCVIAALLCMTACHPGYGYGLPFIGLGVGVGTDYGPYWYPGNYGSFSYVPYPWWGDPPPPPANDPMLEHSATHDAMTAQVRESFTSRGYKESPQGDVDVSVYASARPGDLDISGYTHDYDWKNLPGLQTKAKYPRGTVVVDVLQPKTHLLLWRGTTMAPISDDVEKYKSDLRTAVGRIVEKYPKSKN